MLQLTGAIPSNPEPTGQAEAGALIVERIRGEFREMPGLVLTAAQACRLWRLDEGTCASVLAQLVDAGFLCHKGDSAYGRPSD